MPPRPMLKRCLDNHDCHFVPHVLAMRTTQPFIIKNSDAVGHNTNAALSANAPFNVIIPGGKEAEEKLASAEPTPATVTCNIHPWMKGYVVVLTHPYVAVSAKDGTFEIKNVPAGVPLEFQAWHEASATGNGAVQTNRPELKWANNGRFSVTLQPNEVMDLKEIKNSCLLLGGAIKPAIHESIFSELPDAFSAPGIAGNVAGRLRAIAAGAVPFQFGADDGGQRLAETSETNRRHLGCDVRHARQSVRAAGNRIEPSKDSAGGRSGEGTQRRIVPAALRPLSRHHRRCVGSHGRVFEAVPARLPAGLVQVQKHAFEHAAHAGRFDAHVVGGRLGHGHAFVQVAVAGRARIAR